MSIQGRRTAVALRHVAFEDLGLLSPVLGAAGWDVTYADAPTDDLDDPRIENADLLVVLGGPIGAYETDTYPFLRKEIAILERRLGQRRPTLGICLGCQLMAAALGARVYPGPTKEIGWGHVELTAEGRISFLGALSGPRSAVLHWHGDTFDLPDGATHLAMNAHYANQAFSFGPTAFALQFHIEADPDRLESWYVGHAAELAASSIAVGELRASTAAAAQHVKEQAWLVFTALLEQINKSTSYMTKAV